MELVTLIAPAIIAAGITAAAGLAGTGIGAGINRRNRKAAEEAYEKQREDNIEDFNLANAYNHPAQQMERLRQAGLNPNLVYGKGADTTAAVIKGATPQQPKTENWGAPLQQTASNAIMAYQNVKMQQVQSDNVQANTAATMQDVELKKAQQVATLMQAAKTEQERKLAADLYQLTIDAAKADLAIKQNVVTNIPVDNALKQAQLNAANQNLRIDMEQHTKNMQEQTARIANLWEQKKISMAEALIKTVEAKVAEKYGEASGKLQNEILEQQKKLLIEQIKKAEADGTLAKLEAEAEESLGHTGATLKFIMSLLFK